MCFRIFFLPVFTSDMFNVKFELNIRVKSAVIVAYCMLKL